MYKKLIVIFITLFTLMIFTDLSLKAEFQSDNTFIDIPTANVLPNGRFELSVSTGFPVENLNLNKPDYDLFFSYGLLNKLELRLSMFTLKDWAIDVNYKILDENGNAPALAVGMYNVTYRKYVSSGGGGSDDSVGFPDENYGDVRAIENASLYFVATKSFSDVIKFNIGLGRGRFIGMSGISHYFNISAFSSDWKNVSPDLLVGVFLGGEIRIMPNTYFIAEFDGRDANAGVRYFNKYFSASVAGTHLEAYRAPNNPQISARYYANVTVNSSIIEKPKAPVVKYYQVSGKVVDRNTMEPIKDAYIILPNIGTKKYAVNENGVFMLKFKKGEYWIRALAPGYYWQQQKVIVNDATGELHFLLRKKVKKVVKKLTKEKPVVKKKIVTKPKTTVKKKIVTKKKTVRKKPKINLSKLYSQGIQAYLAGDYKKAVYLFKRVSRVNPNYKNVRTYLKKAELRLKALGG